MDRRRSIQLPPTPFDKVHRRLPHLFGGIVPGRSKDARDSNSDGEPSPEELESRDNFLGRVSSYSKLMHAHTKFQLGSLAMGTLPSYTKTMHDFTLNQMNHQRQIAKSEMAGPQPGIGGRQLMLPRRICAELNKLSLEELPPGPASTPEPAHLADPRRTRQRSVTEPILLEFAASIRSRDFAAA